MTLANFFRILHPLHFAKKLILNEPLFNNKSSWHHLIYITLFSLCNVKLTQAIRILEGIATIRAKFSRCVQQCWPVKKIGFRQCLMSRITFPLLIDDMTIE